MDKKKLISIVIGMTILFLVGIGFWYLSQKKSGTPEPLQQIAPKEKSSVGTAKTISESVPKIQTNQGEKVPEINPLDRANPFKYINPLR